MRKMGLDENLMDWTDSFIRNRKVIISVGGQDGEPTSVTTDLPQGSQISPALFAIYIAEIHGAVERQVEGSRGISFADGIVGGDINDIVHGLERCATASLRWADDSAVRIKPSKTEAVLVYLLRHGI